MPLLSVALYTIISAIFNQEDYIVLLATDSHSLQSSVAKVPCRVVECDPFHTQETRDTQWAHRDPRCALPRGWLEAEGHVSCLSCSTPDRTGHNHGSRVVDEEAAIVMDARVQLDLCKVPVAVYMT